MKGIFKLGLSIQDTKKLSKNYIFNCFFLISVKKGGAHKTKVLDSMLVFRCSPINSIELSRLVYRSWIKMSETLGKESVKNGPNLSSSLAQILMGDTSLSEAKYNYFRFLLYFTKYVFMCHYLSIFIHRWRYKSTNLLWHWQWFTLRKLHYTNSTPQQALLYKFITI